MEKSLDGGFSLGKIGVYPLDSRIVGRQGPKALSPIAMDVLLELASAHGAHVSKEHLVFQIWGSSTPDAGTLEHYVAELKHELNHDQHPLIVNDEHSYWLTESPSELVIEEQKTGLWAELQRRKVTQTALLYLVAAWLIIQIADVIFPALGLGDKAIRIVVFAAFFGFPISLILSWFYDVKLADDPEVEDKSTSLNYVIAAALVAIPIAYGYQWFNPSEETSALGSVAVQEAVKLEHNSIAVLPFLNLGSDNTYDYFGDGVADEILSALSSTGKLLVAPRTSSFIYKNSKTTVKDMGHQLGVRYVLEGGVRRVTDRVRVTATLIDVLKGYTIWSKSYDQLLSDIFTVQQDISRRVVESLDIVLSAQMSKSLGAPRTASVEAYDFYLQGRDYLNRPTSVRTLNSAIQLFDKAIAIDPEYADAFAGLCDSYIVQYIETNTTEWFNKAEKACKETLKFDFVTIGVRIALGNLYRESGQYARAQEQLAIALAKAPDNVDAVSALAKAHAAAGELEKAEAFFNKAIGLQPRFWRGHDDLGSFLIHTGRAAEAIPAYRKTIELTPDNALAFNNLGAALIMTNNFDEAAAAWQKSLEIEVTEAASSNAGTSLFFAGRFDEAATMYRKATELTPDRHALWGNLADAERLGSSPHAAMDHYRRAITLAEDALTINPNNMATTAFLAHYCAQVGQTERAQQLLTKAIKDGSKDLYIWYYVALTYLTLDNKVAAAQSLKKAIDLGYSVAMVKADKGLAELTSDSSYRKLIGL